MLIFPKAIDRDIKTPLLLVSSFDILKLYNKDNVLTNKLNIDAKVMEWFVTKAINQYGWIEANIKGKCCLLKRN